MFCCRALIDCYTCKSKKKYPASVKYIEILYFGFLVRVFEMSDLKPTGNATEVLSASDITGFIGMSIH